MISIIFSDIAPLLDQENVCDEIVKGMRQDKHLILLPKSILLTIILNRFEERRKQQIFIHQYFLFQLELHQEDRNLKYTICLVYINQWIHLLVVKRNQPKIKY